MVYFQRVRGYKKQLSGFFDSTDYRYFALVTGCSNYLVSSAPRIACKPSADSAGADYVFDICKDKTVVGHLLKKVWNRKLVFTVASLLPDDINDSQSRSFLSSSLSQSCVGDAGSRLLISGG